MKLQKHLEKHGLTLAEFAKKTGNKITEATLSRIANDKCEPTLTNALIIQEASSNEVTVSDLVKI